MNAELAGTASFALGAGAATFFSPCAYALLPGYVGYYAAAVDERGVRRGARRLATGRPPGSTKLRAALLRKKPSTKTAEPK